MSSAQQAIANETEARTQAVSSLDAKFSGQIDGVNQEIASNISQVNQAIANEASARSSADTALSTRIGNTESAVTQKLDSWIDNGQVGAQYALKLGIKSGGLEYTSGVSLSLVQTGSGVQSQFLVDAARFGVMTQQGGSYTLPFVVDNGTVIMNTALIKNGSITNAMIGNVIQSNDYVAGYSGWRLDKNGNLEINGRAGNGRLTINNNIIAVYDGNGVLRVRMGLF